MYFFPYCTHVEYVASILVHTNNCNRFGESISGNKISVLLNQRGKTFFSLLLSFWQWQQRQQRQQQQQQQQQQHNNNNNNNNNTNNQQ